MYRAAAAYFKANNITKLPNPKKLEAEYAQLASEKAKFYEQYKEAKPSTSHQPQVQGGKLPRPCA